MCAFSKSWNEGEPDGAVITVSQLDNYQRDEKVAVRERLEGDPADANTGVFQSGSFAAAPKIKELRGKTGVVSNVTYGHDGDADTGVNIPANDQLELVAGGVSLLFGTSTGIRAGTGTERFLLGGRIMHAFPGVGNVGTGEDTLWSDTIPANTLDAAGKAVRVSFVVSLAANSNTKRVRLRIGGNVAADTGPQTTSGVPKYMSIVAMYDGTSTLHTFGYQGAGYGDAWLNPAFTATSDQAVAITGEAVADNDIILRAVLVEFIG